MEPQGQHIQQQNQEQNEDSGSSSNSKSSFLCRQSSTRWTPTTDQIRILKDLYYNNGVRSPTAEQIQRISTRLRQYGKIEGKNVFYWFQNHKARERQKKRFTVDMAMQQRGGAGNSGWKPEDSTYNKYNNINPGVSSHAPPGVLAVGKTGSIGYGSVLMEKSFRDCSITSGAAGSVSISNNLGRVGLDSYLSPHTVSDKRKSIETFEPEAPEIETLPLFPMRGEDIAGYCNVDAPQTEGHYPFWYTPDEHDNGNSSTSLELTLSSYTGRRSDSE